MNNATILGLLATAALAGTAQAGNIVDIGDTDPMNGPTLITQSTTWTADNIYNLLEQIYVVDGATLTIEAGTLIQSDTTADGAGSLAIAKGSRIIAKGTKRAPIIFTSSDDDLMTYREGANEWGNLTVMGCGYISDTIGADGAMNSCSPAATNQSNMEGLTEAGLRLYGGDNDDDNSGCIQYCSFRYGGRVVGLANELNGLSLGGIGRATDVSHVEVVNNVDDGIEIWGGTVNVKYASILNIGDDSFDVDQGWRGKAQFILIVQGFSARAGQGSGVGDNCFEVDGAEDSNCQPVTTATIYNATVIGQPSSGDGGTVWRDGARVQYRNCIFMDLGEELVRFDGDDGDGSSGYGFGGSLPFIDPMGPDVWDTAFSDFSGPNRPADTAAFYQSQVDGFKAEITGSLFYRNLGSDAYAPGQGGEGSDTVGVTIAGGSNPALMNVVAPAVFDPMNPDAELPITRLVRDFSDVADDDDPKNDPNQPGINIGGRIQFPVVSLDPTPVGAALGPVPAAPNDGFFSPVTYRGAFGPDAADNWLCDWSGISVYGILQNPAGGCAEREECTGDFDNSGAVDTGDLLALLAAWGTEDPNFDLDMSGTVDTGDLLALLAAWGTCP